MNLPLLQSAQAVCALFCCTFPVTQSSQPAKVAGVGCTDPGKQGSQLVLVTIPLVLLLSTQPTGHAAQAVELVAVNATPNRPEVHCVQADGIFPATASAALAESATLTPNDVVPLQNPATHDAQTTPICDPSDCAPIFLDSTKPGAQNSH